MAKVTQIQLESELLDELMGVCPSYVRSGTAAVTYAVIRFLELTKDQGVAADEPSAKA